MSETLQRKCEDALGHPIGRLASWWLHADPRPLLLLALVLMFGYFWVYRSPTVAMVRSALYDGFYVGAFLFGLLAAGRGVQLFGRKSYAARFGVPSDVCWSRRRFWPWLGVIAAGTYVMLWAQLPMRVSFLLSRPEFDRMADEVLADPANAHRLAGRWAGLYRVNGVEVIGSTVILYLDEDKENYGFARVSEAADDVIFNISGLKDNPHYHRDFPNRDGAKDPVGKRITGDWFVMYSSYWSAKIGWS